MRGFPLQIVRTCRYPELPTSILTQPLWHTRHGRHFSAGNIPMLHHTCTLAILHLHDPFTEAELSPLRQKKIEEAPSLQ